RGPCWSRRPTGSSSSCPAPRSSASWWRPTRPGCWGTRPSGRWSASPSRPTPRRNMPVSSLADRIPLLETGLKAVPPRISVYHDLPFAILRYDPAEEWEMRRQARLLATRLAEVGKEVVTVSMAGLLWEAIDTTEGLDAVVELERQRGFVAAQEQ